MGEDFADMFLMLVGVLGKMRMLLRYTTTNLSRQSAKIVFMRHWKVAGAFVRPKMHYQEVK